uniref:Uncharacterized protein n=1 Tax=Solanum tuberosum TaxID=4113 RepID=M1DAA0_SOLTU
MTFPRALVVACVMQSIELNMGAQIFSEWKVFYRGNKEAFFLPGLVIAMCKREGVPLLDADEVLPMDPPFHHLMVRQGSTSRSKNRRTGRARSSQETTEADDEGGDDGAGGDIHPNYPQPPLSKACVEKDLAVVWRLLGCSFSSTTSVPPRSTLEVEMLRRQLCQEMRKGLVRDRLMARIWKTIKVIFSCLDPDMEITRIEPEDYAEFPILNEAWAGEKPPEVLNSNDDTSQSQGS